MANFKERVFGRQKVITIIPRTLRPEFETYSHERKEPCSRISFWGVRNCYPRETYGENVSNETIVSKNLRSLTKEFDHVKQLTENLNIRLALEVGPIILVKTSTTKNNKGKDTRSP